MVSSNAAQVAATFDNLAAGMQVKVTALVRMYGALLKTRVMARASGRPGPRAVTGDYRRSWTDVLRANGTGVSVTVGTNKPQGRRLEYGYFGADSLGRVYSQPPYPHLGPAVSQTRPEFTAALANLLTLG